MSNEWDKHFEDIVSRMGGVDEQNFRQNMNDEQHAEFIAFARASNVISLQKDSAQIYYLKSLAFLQRATGFAIIFAILIGLGWSVYAWI